MMLPLTGLHLLQQRALMSTIARVVLVTFTWLVVYPTALAAQTPSPRPTTTRPPAPPPADDTAFPALLAAIETLLQREQAPASPSAAAALAAAPLAAPSELPSLRQRLADLDTQARQQFAQMAQHLQAHHLPEVLHQRHREVVATYESAVTTLRQQLDALAAAPTPQARQAHAAQAPRAKRAFDPHRLPFRTPDGTVRKAKETKEDYQTALTPPQPVLVASGALLPGILAAPAAALPATPTPDDLAPTEDVPLTDEIRALAVSLGHNPVQSYNWVHDQIEFMPTYGSIQGAHMTLQTTRGNAFDTASLLIALLRAANIPARYVYGTVQIPIDQVMNWVGGVTVPEAALQVLGQGGIPNTGLVQGGVITAVKLDHVWVEAWVDFLPSQGAKHVQGDTWVPLDASFKQYTYTEGVNLQATVPFDAPAFLTQVTASAQVNEAEGWVAGLDHALLQQALTTYQAQVQAYVTAQKPDATVGDVLGTKRIAPSRHPVLAAGLPYLLVTQGATWQQVPDALRHQFRFALYTNALERLSEISVLSLQQSLVQLAGKKLTLSFAPATQADIDLIASALPAPPADGSPLDPSALPTALPDYLIRLVAELRVEGQVVARGGQFSMGQVLVSTAGLYDPGRGWQEEENTPPIAGEYRIVAINAAGLAVSQVQTLRAKLATTKIKLDTAPWSGFTAEEVIGDLFYSTVLSYFATTDIAGEVSANAARVVTYRRPSFGSVTVKVQPRLLFGIPRTVTFPGFELDMTRLDSMVVSMMNSRTAQIGYVQRNGLRQSAYEHRLLEQLTTATTPPVEAVSAVKALAVVSRQGQRLYTLTPDNVAQALSQLTVDPDILADIQAAVATGKHAIIS